MFVFRTACLGHPSTNQPNDWTGFVSLLGQRGFWRGVARRGAGREQLRSLSRAGGFWGLLTLLNDVYLPLARPMYRALLSAVQLPPPPPSPPSAAPHVNPPESWRGLAPVGKTAVEETPESGIPGEFDPGANRRADNGGSGSYGRDGDGSCGGAVLAEGGACVSFSAEKEGSPVGSAGAGVSGAGAEGHGTWGGGASCDEDEGAASAVCEAIDSSLARPFDLVVLDMGSLGGLDFAQKLVRRGCDDVFESQSPSTKTGVHLLHTLSGVYRDDFCAKSVKLQRCRRLPRFELSIILRTLLGTRLPKTQLVSLCAQPPLPP